MNFNTIVLRFGLDPENFVMRENEPLETEDGFIYELFQRDDIRLCPRCGSNDACIHSHYPVEKSFTINAQLKEKLRIIKPRFMCNHCHKTLPCS